MIEFYVLRSILCILEFSVAVLIVRRDAGHLFGFVAYAYFAGTADLIPALIQDAGWWRSIWAPLHAILMLLLVYAAWDAFRFVLPHTGRSERLAVGIASVLVGVLFVGILAPTWAPANSFQVFCRAREFVALAMAAAFTSAWYCWRVLRPVECSSTLRRHLGMMAAWLWVYWICSASAKGGSVWLVTSWEGGADVWRALNAVCMSSQVILMGGWCLSLRSCAIIRTHAATESA